jgi:hypothetical protein
MGKNVFLGVVGFVLFLALMCGLDYSGLMWESFIGPKRENIRRNIFEQTKSYNQANIQQLVEYRKQYMQGSKDDKAIIANTVSHMFADYSPNGLDIELSEFLKLCKYGDIR